MSLGLDMFLATRKEKKCHDLEVTTPVAYPTGYMPLDYINGQEVNVYDDNDDIVETYDSVGFVEGTMITVIADSGLGKSTAVQQFCTAMAANFEDSFVIHEDIEQAGHANRVYNISGMTSRWLKAHYRIFQDASSEILVDRFIDHAKTKLNNRSTFSYDTGLKDMYGDKIIRLQPTFVIIDSLAVLRSGETDFTESPEKSINNMAGARNAKLNSENFKQMLPYAKKANIIIFVINHITKKVETGFVKSARDLIGLGESESLPGGRAAVYLANNVLRFKNKQTLKSDKDYGINGLIISASFLKSRTNASQTDVELIFDKTQGFSKILTLHNHADNLGLFNGKTNKSIPGFEDIVFTKKTFLETCRNNTKLVPALYELVLPSMRALLSSSEKEYNGNETDEQRLNAYMSIMSNL
jgi:hypothetical protein